MKHQPFDQWLLSEEPISKDDELLLRNHLEVCDQCSELENAWLDISNIIHEMPDVEPEPGFVNRWQTTLEADHSANKAMRQRWQSWIVLVFIANGAALALFFVGLQLINTYGSVSDWILSWVYRVATVVLLASGLQNALLTLFRTVPQLIPTGWWFGITAILSISTIIWIISMSRLSALPRRIS